MLKIRRHTFETNSSSMHSLNILSQEKGVVETLEQAQKENPRMTVEDGTLTIDNSELEFGWGFDVLNTAYDRMCYVIAQILETDDSEESKDRCIDIVHQAYPEINYIEINGDSWGYIDHESVGTVSGHWDDEKLIEFIKNSKNYVIVDNDNDPHTSQLKALLSENEETQEGLFKAFEKIDFGKDDYDFEEDYEEEEEI